MTTATLLWGVVFGALGLGYFIYGRRQRMAVPLLCGIALMTYPYFVSSAWLLVLIGAGLAAVPYFIRM